MKQYRDFYFRKAKTENYPARSIYKLKELNARFHLLRKGMKTLDLGAAPGSWSLGCAEMAGSDGFVLACDLKPVAVELPPQVSFVQTDVFDQSDEFKSLLVANGPFDLVMSDMAPATTGSKFTDQARSYDLACAAFELASGRLRIGGNFIVKIFTGPDSQNLLVEMRKVFGQAKAFKPKSSRPESRETFFVGINFLGGAAGQENAK